MTNTFETIDSAALGFPNAANGAEQSVRDVAAQYGATVKENR